MRTSGISLPDGAERLPTLQIEEHPLPLAELPVQPAAEAVTEPSPGGELDLFAFFLVLRSHWMRIVLCAFGAMLLMVAYTLTVKPRFAATASMLIPQQNTSAAGLALQAAAGMDLIGGGNELFIDILKSRAVLDRIIDQYNLRQAYGTKELARTEAALSASTTLSASREGLLQVSVQDVDPKRAADIANSYLAELDRENQELAIGSASQQRRYFEQEMVKEKNALADAEVNLKELEEKSGVLEPGAQAQAGLSATENTRAQLRARQVELGALLQSETPQNPDVLRVRGEVASLEAQLQALQSQGGPAAGTPATKAPSQVLEYVRRAREVKFHEALFEMLARQYSTAKEQEAKNVSMIEVLDKATPPERKSWPPRTIYCLAAFLAGAIFAIAYTIIERIVRTIARNPRNRERYQELVRRSRV